MLREPKPIVDADRIGIDTLTFIASQDELMQRFIDLTGFEVSTLRIEAGRPGFFVDVLDFILGHEPDVLDLASRLAVPPSAIGQARNTLAKKAGQPLIDVPT